MGEVAVGAILLTVRVGRPEHADGAGRASTTGEGFRRRAARLRVFIAIAVAALVAAGCASSPTASHAHHHNHHHLHHNDHPHTHRHGHHHHHHAHPHHHHHHDHDHAHSEDDHADLHPSHDPDAPCACDDAKMRDRWCRRCSIGYVAGVPVESAILFSTLDPHGHDIDFATLDCDDCRSAVASDGFCDECGMGFINSLAYFTRLTHGLANGRPMQHDALRCRDCRANSAGQGGWCDRCARGMVGNVAFADRRDFTIASREFSTFLAAIEKTRECEICACAMVVYRTCPHCRITYERPDSARHDAAAHFHTPHGD